MFKSCLLQHLGLDQNMQGHSNMSCEWSISFSRGTNWERLAMLHAAWTLDKALSDSNQFRSTRWSNQPLEKDLSIKHLREINQLLCLKKTTIWFYDYMRYQFTVNTCSQCKQLLLGGVGSYRTLAKLPFEFFGLPWRFQTWKSPCSGKTTNKYVYDLLTMKPKGAKTDILGFAHLHLDPPWALATFN